MPPTSDPKTPRWATAPKTATTDTMSRISRTATSRWCCFAAASLLVSIGPAQTPASRPTDRDPGAHQQPGSELAKRLAEYLERDFLKAASWQMDWEQAQAEAKKEDKIILGYFTSSIQDHEGPRMFERQVFTDPGIKAFGDSDVVLFCHVMSQVPGRDNDDMRRVARSRSLPAVVYFNTDGSWLFRQPITRPTETTLADLKSHVDALKIERRHKRATAGKKGITAPPPAELLHAEILLRRPNLKFPEAKKRFDKLKEIPAELTASMAARLLRMELDHMSIQYRLAGPDQIGPLYIKMFEEGRAPKGSSNEAFGFWANLINFSLRTGQLRIAKQGLGGMKECAKERRLLQNAVQDYEKRINKALEARR